MWSVLFASFSFVASVYDTCSSLASGCNHGDHTGIQTKNIDLIVRFYQEKHITITFLPPYMAMKFMKYDESRLNLRALLVGSDRAQPWSRRATELLMYAASETCSLAAAYDINSHEKCYPIGTLNPNLKGYIVDEDGKPVKPGTEGELWLAGPQITRGYFKRRSGPGSSLLIIP